MGVSYVKPNRTQATDKRADKHWARRQAKKKSKPKKSLDVR